MYGDTARERSDARIRDALGEDLAAIFEIYDHYVLESVATFDTRTKSPEEREAWFRSHDPGHHALLVAEDASGAVVGWCGLGSWSPKCAYARAAELSIYVAPGLERRGIGLALLGAMIERAEKNGIGVLLARIADRSRPSLALHRRFGFRSIGVMHGVGEKFGRILDVELMELPLTGKGPGAPERD